MATLQVVTTSRGRQAVLDADIQGLKLRITHVAAGSAGYQPSVSATALRSEFVRAPIAKAEVNKDRYQLNLSAAFTGEEEGWIREIGFFAEDGTLVWLWSSADTALGYKSAPTRFLVGLSLTVTDVPLGQIEIVDQGQPLELAVQPIADDSATASAALAAAFTDEGRRGLDRDARLDALADEVRRIKQQRDQDVLGQMRVLEDRLSASQGVLSGLVLSAASAAEAQAEILRASGQSGLVITRQYDGGGPDPWDRRLTVGYAAGNAHDHANAHGVMGLAELAVVVNGWYLRTRHNDYVDNTPAPAGGAYLSTRRLPMTTLPASVTGGVAQQTAAMRELILKAAVGGLAAADAQHFRLDLAYLEVWWEVLPPDGAVGDSFYSPRHEADDRSAAGLLNTIQAINATGAKLRAENNPYVPIAIRSIRGRTEVAVLRYRILTRTVGTLAERPISALVELVDDVITRKRTGMTLAALEASRLARYRLRDEIADDLMAMVPGLDGEGAVLHERYWEEGAWKTVRGYESSALLNAAYYSRKAALSTADASGRSKFRRGFNDPSLWAALTTRKRVAGFERDGDVYRASWAIPLELVLRTPLEAWNPYDIPQSDGGSGTEEKPYQGWLSDRYWRTPAELFGGAGASDSADTSSGVKWVLDASGTARAVRASGVRVILPPVDDGAGGTISLRTRYPVYPVYHEGSPAYIEAMARLEGS
ncbi:phage tail protein [Tistrella mobilis]|uniref:phage tail-collar fiber domain-containing protein n=1 Tax=Tistrella mobilis TaxID=171437 RepID=UPI003555F748